MRYRDTGDYQNMGVPVDDDLMFFSIITGIVSGSGFIAFGLRVK